MPARSPRADTTSPKAPGCSRCGVAFLLLIVALAVAPPSTYGQEAVPAEARARRFESVLKVGDPIRAFPVADAPVEGRLLAPWPGSRLRIDAGGTGMETIELPRAVLDSLEVGRHRGSSGAVVGGVVGAGLGLLLVQAIGDLVCDAPDDDCDSEPDAIAWIGFGTGGAALGGGIGWLIGKEMRRWERVFP
jgi:hypothetical protein